MLHPASLTNPAVTSTFSNAEWRWAIVSIGIGAILLTVGFIAAGIFLFRKQTTDRTLLYFGIYVILYAVRVFLREPPLLSVFSISPSVAGHIIRTITFTFALPLLFLFLEVVQTRWRPVILWMPGVQLVFATFALLFDLLGVARRAVDITNSLLVLASWILLIFFLFVFRPPVRLPRELPVVAVGLVVDGFFVMHTHWCPAINRTRSAG